LITSSVSQTFEEHTAILNALSKGDVEKAVEASIEHVLDSGKWLEEYLEVPAELLREKEQQVIHLIKKSK
jgi:DNA-binding GntR family transcriptional regulator